MSRCPFSDSARATMPSVAILCDAGYGRSGVDAADRGRVGHALDRQHVGRVPHVDTFVDAGVEDLVEGPSNDVVELRVDLLLLPEEGLEILDPLEVGHDHATRVGEDVGN